MYPPQQQVAQQPSNPITTVLQAMMQAYGQKQMQQQMQARTVNANNGLRLPQPGPAPSAPSLTPPVQGVSPQFQSPSWMDYTPTLPGAM